MGKVPTNKKECKSTKETLVKEIDSSRKIITEITPRQLLCKRVQDEYYFTIIKSKKLLIKGFYTLRVNRQYKKRSYNFYSRAIED